METSAEKQVEQWFRDCFDKAPAQALPTCQQLASGLDALPQAPWQLRVRLYSRLSDLLMELGRYAEAESPARKALQAAESASGPQSQPVSMTLERLGTVLKATGKLEQAEAVLRKALELDEAAKGKQDPQVAVALGNLAGVLKDRGKPELAERFYRRSLVIQEAVLGKDHPQVAITLSNLAVVLQDQGKPELAEPLLRRSLAIAEAVLGKDHPKVAITLSNLAGVLKDRGKPELAEPLLRRSLAIQEAALGKDHPDVAIALSNLAAVLHARGKSEQAELLLRRSLAIKEAALGKDHLQVAITLNNLAWVLKDRGKPELAEPLLRRALAIVEAVLGKDHPQVAITLNNLAAVLQDRGKPEQAEPLYRRALAIVEAVLGKDHPLVATTLNNLAGVLKDRGKPEQAEPLYRRALAIVEATLGKDHPQVAGALNNLAGVLKDRGKPELAEPLCRRALAIVEAALGKDHPQVASALNNLALLLQDRGKPELAEPLYRRALAIVEAALGKDHPKVAITLSNLAWVLKDRGKPELAEPLLRRSLAIEEAALGKEHPQVAITLNNLAGMLKDRGQLEQAEPLLRRALAIEEAALGKDHPTIATTLDNLSSLHLSQGQTDQARQELGRSLRLRETGLRTSPTEDYATGLLETMQATHRAIYGLPLVAKAESSAATLAMQTALLNKSRTLEIGTMVNSQLRQALKTEEQKQRYQRMQLLLQERARLLDKASGNSGGRREAKQLLEQAQQLEQALAQEVGLQSSQRLPEPEQVVERVASRLPAQAALVEVVLGITADYRRADWGKTVESRYIALVLYPDGKVQALDLGTEQQVVPVALQLLRALENLEPEVQSKAQAAYQQVFAPLDRELRQRKVKRLVVAPDEALELIPWGAMHDGTGYLVERYQIQYVEAGRDLLKEPESGEVQAAVVLADPEAPGQRRLNTARKVSLALARKMGVQALVDREATKENLRTRARPYTMLLAAHGEYRPAAGGEGQMSARRRPKRVLGQMLPEPAGGGGAETPEGMWSREEAMHWSALALAPGGQSRQKSEEDGRLTGDEVKELNLRGTQLVTMLACQSGRGAVSSGQGVYGIRRALLQAGAETVASTLWSVEEGSASEIVKRYYEKLLGGRGRVEAMAEAMREVRGLKEHPEYSHPYYWAPFIVMGKDGPLRPPKQQAP